MIKTELFKNDNFEEFCMACKTSFAIKLSEKNIKQYILRYIKQQRRMILEKRETNKVSPMIVPACHLEREVPGQSIGKAKRSIRKANGG